MTFTTCNRFRTGLLGAVAIGLFTGINGCIPVDTLGPADIRDVSINASSYDEYTYFNLDTHQVVELTDNEAQLSTDWHIAFKRYDVILNGGTSGPGNVSAALAVAQDDFYNADGTPNASVFLNASRATEQEHLLGTLNEALLSYTQDAYAPAIKGPGTTVNGVKDAGWYLYNASTHDISVNSDNWWLLRSAAGNSYAKFHATSLAYGFGSGLAVSFEFLVQPNGASSFTQSATFSTTLASGEACFDFDANATADCAGSHWDLKLTVAGTNWKLWTNGGTSGSGQGAALGSFTTAQSPFYVSGTVDLLGNNIAALYMVDQSASLFGDKLWYAYNIDGTHKLAPNYRVYMINTDHGVANATKYRVQIASYYNNAGASGYPQVRIVTQP